MGWLSGTISSCVFNLFLIFCFLFVSWHPSHRKRKRDYITKFMIYTYEFTNPPHLYFCLRWVKSSSQPLSSLKWSLLVNQSGMLDQAYLVISSALEETLNTVNSFKKFFFTASFFDNLVSFAYVATQVFTLLFNLLIEHIKFCKEN